MTTPKICRSALALVSCAAAGCSATFVEAATALADAKPRLVTRAQGRFSASADGSVIAVSSNKGNSVAVFDLATGRKKTLRFPSVQSGGVQFSLTRDGRKVIYATTNRPHSSVPKTVVYDLKTNSRVSYSNYEPAGLVDGSGRYIAVWRGVNTASNPSGILDLRTRRFVRVPRPTPHYERFGVYAISGDGDWVIYLDASLDRNRCYSFSRVTREKHFLGLCNQERFAMSDDGRVASLGFNLFLNARTGTRLPGFQAQGAFQYGSGKFFNGGGGAQLSADGATTAVACRTGLFTVDLATGVYSRVARIPAPTDPNVEASDFSPTLTANGNALVYKNATGIYEVSTAGAVPIAGIPEECVSTTTKGVSPPG